MCPKGTGSTKTELRLPDEPDAARQLKAMVSGGEAGSSHRPWPAECRVVTVRSHKHAI